MNYTIQLWDECHFTEQYLPLYRSKHCLSPASLPKRQALCCHPDKQIVLFQYMECQLLLVGSREQTVGILRIFFKFNNVKLYFYNGQLQLGSTTHSISKINFTCYPFSGNYCICAQIINKDILNELISLKPSKQRYFSQFSTHTTIYPPSFDLITFAIRLTCAKYWDKQGVFLR